MIGKSAEKVNLIIFNIGNLILYENKRIIVLIDN